MSNYAIMRFAKYKLASVAKVERHQEGRFQFLNNLKHPERASEDIIWKQNPELTMTKVLRGVIQEHEQTTGKKFRKDGVALVEFVMTFSPEVEAHIDFDKWHRANVRWIEKQFGKNNLIRYDTNNMESTRHAHYFVMPVADGKLNASHFFGKKQQIIEMQNTYAEAMAPFGLARGESKERTQARHQTLHEWKKAECERLERELEAMADDILAEQNEASTHYDIDSDIFDNLL